MTCKSQYKESTINISSSLTSLWEPNRCVHRLSAGIPPQIHLFISDFYRRAGGRPSLTQSLLMFRVLFYVLSSLAPSLLDVLLSLPFLPSSFQSVIISSCRDPRLITQSKCADFLPHFISPCPWKGDGPYTFQSVTTPPQWTYWSCL